MLYRERVLHFYRLRRKDGHLPSQALSIAKHDAKYRDIPFDSTRKLDILPSRRSAYEGKKITILPNGWKIKAEFQHDSDFGSPWEEYDGHGVVCDWEHGRREYDDAWILQKDRHSYRYYDWKASLEIAFKEWWGCKPYGISSAMDAVKSDFEYLRRWCNDEWWYVGMTVTLYDADTEDGEEGEEIASESVWGFESDCMDYLCSEARSWAAHMIVKERRERRDAARQERIAHRFADAMECGV